jgi:hypothetical protein
MLQEARHRRCGKELSEEGLLACLCCIMLLCRALGEWQNALDWAKAVHCCVDQLHLAAYTNSDVCCVVVLVAATTNSTQTDFGHMQGITPQAAAASV